MWPFGTGKSMLLCGGDQCVPNPVKGLEAALPYCILSFFVSHYEDPSRSEGGIEVKNNNMQWTCVLRFS